MSTSPDSSSVASTVTSGIQDISALLPLLGTDQCEEHTGSALVKGYCYICVTPISIFGSLGIVKAGFNVLFASIIVPSWKFLGARRLADGGFQPRGDVAKLIALDSQNPKRFLAESNLERILEDEHIENVEDMKIDWATDSLKWNIKMAFSTLLVSSIGIIPYLYIILHASDDNPLFLSGWGFPIIRLFGSAMSGIIIQFIIQIRMLGILRHRLVFLIMDNYIRALDEHNTLDKRHIDKLRQFLPDWGTGRASELCLWDLQIMLHSQQMLSGNDDDIASSSTSETKNDSPGDTVLTVDNEKQSYDFSLLIEHFERTKRSHLGPNPIPLWMASPSDYMTIGTLHLLLLVGLVLSIGGYIGCFNLIQTATRAGPLLWLFFEIFLCILRIVVWAWNPDSDDNKGIAFTLSLASQSPLVTCDLYGDKVESSDEVPVVRSETFLRDIASYSGPLPAFHWNDAALYYILTGKEYIRSDDYRPTIRKVLYIVVLAFKEQTSRLVVKQDIETGFSFFVTELRISSRRKVVSIGGIRSTRPETHVLTSDPKFVQALSDHYDAIVERVNCGDLTESQIHWSWALQKINSGNPTFNESLEDAPALIPTLTDADLHYLDQGRLVSMRDEYAQCLVKWTERYLKAFESELLDQIPFSSHNHNQMTKHQGIETNETEYLIAEARFQMEQLIVDTLRSWRRLIGAKHNKMAELVTNEFKSAAQRTSRNVVPDVETDTAAKIGDRLRSEKDYRLDCALDHDLKETHKRIDNHRNIVVGRIQKRRYLDPKEGDKIIEMWHNRLSADKIWETYYLGAFGGIATPNPTCSIKDLQLKSYARSMKKRFVRREQFLGGEKGKDLEDRCKERLEIWKVKLRAIADECTMLKEDTFFEKELKGASETRSEYWSEAAVEQRISLLDQNKYLVISNRLVTDIGGFENLALALRHSQASVLYFRCSLVTESGVRFDVKDDVESSDDDDTLAGDRSVDAESDSNVPPPCLKEETMHRIAKSTPFITDIHFSSKIIYTISDAVQDVLKKHRSDILEKRGPRMICMFEDIEIADSIRLNRPYVSLMLDSTCTIEFCVDEIAEHTLILTHAFMLSYAEIEIKINGWHLTKTTGGLGRPPFEFHDEVIKIPMNRLTVRPERNKVTLELIPRSKSGTYGPNDEFHAYCFGGVELCKTAGTWNGPVFARGLHEEPQEYASS